MEDSRHAIQENDLPKNLSQPAQRALAAAGFARLEQFTQISEREILALHGVGPKAIVELRRALHANGQSFAESDRRPTSP